MRDSNKVEILLVEDDPEEAELALEALRRKRIANRVVVAKDGEEALNLLFGGEPAMPQLILLDLKLPKMDGFEVLKKLKSDERTKIIPVVALTSSSLDKDILRSYYFGVNSYVVKPVDFNTFVDVVDELGRYWLLLNKLPE